MAVLAAVRMKNKARDAEPYIRVMEQERYEATGHYRMHWRAKPSETSRYLDWLQPPADGGAGDPMQNLTGLDDFDAADESLSGTLDFAEFMRLAKARSKDNKRKSLSKEKLRVIFSELDVDGSGALSKSEYFNFVLRDAACGDDNGVALKKHFQSFDVDGSGALDSAEFSEACAAMGFGEVAPALMAILGGDGAGGVDYIALILEIRRRFSSRPNSSGASLLSAKGEPSSPNRRASASTTSAPASPGILSQPPMRYKNSKLATSASAGSLVPPSSPGANATPAASPSSVSASSKPSPPRVSISRRSPSDEQQVASSPERTTRKVLGSYESRWFPFQHGTCEDSSQVPHDGVHSPGGGGGSGSRTSAQLARSPSSPPTSPTARHTDGSPPLQVDIAADDPDPTTRYATWYATAARSSPSPSGGLPLPSPLLVLGPAGWRESRRAKSPPPPSHEPDAPPPKTTSRVPLDTREFGALGGHPARGGAGPELEKNVADTIPLYPLYRPNGIRSKILAPGDTAVASTVAHNFATRRKYPRIPLMRPHSSHGDRGRGGGGGRSAGVVARAVLLPHGTGFDNRDARSLELLQLPGTHQQLMKRGVPSPMRQATRESKAGGLKTSASVPAGAGALVRGGRVPAAAPAWAPPPSEHNLMQATPGSAAEVLCAWPPQYDQHADHGARPGYGCAGAVQHHAPASHAQNSALAVGVLRPASSPGTSSRAGATQQARSTSNITAETRTQLAKELIESGVPTSKAQALVRKVIGRVTEEHAKGASR